LDEASPYWIYLYEQNYYAQKCFTLVDA